MNQTRIAHLLRTVAVAALAALAACGGDDMPAEPAVEGTLPTDTAALRVAVMPTTDCLPLFVAEDRGLFERAGLDVQLCEYAAQMDCDTAMLRGRVDAVATDLVRAEYMQQQGKALRYVAVTDPAWQLVTNRTARIRQLEQLDDHMVAMTRLSATHLLTDHVVTVADLDADRVFCIQVNDIGVRQQMLLTGVMDALWLPQPQATAARLAQHTYIYNAREAVGALGVIAFSDSALVADTLRREQLRLFTAVYDEACDSLTAHGVAAYRDVVARHCGVAPQVADTLQADSLVTFLHATAPAEADVVRARDWLLRQQKETNQ